MIKDNPKIQQLVQIFRDKPNVFEKTINMPLYYIKFFKSKSPFSWRYMYVKDKNFMHKMLIEVRKNGTHTFEIYYVREIYFIKWLNKCGFPSVDHFLDYLIYQII